MFSNATSWLWLLAIGALFYWFMRKGGCGMHAGHSQHGGHGHGAAGSSGDGQDGGHGGHESQGGSVRDPVCGMEVDPERAAGMRTVKGRNYFLCSPSCLEKFDQEPERYAATAPQAESSKSGHTGHRRHAGC